MPHKVTQSFEQLCVGARIRLKSWQYDPEIVEKLPENRLLVAGNGPTSNVSYADYMYTLVCSFGFHQMNSCRPFSEEEVAWTDCERYYGINYLGETDPCPLRRLAFLILKGDPMALDAARDALKC